MISLLIFLPLIGSALAALAPGGRQSPRRVGGVLLVFALATLALAIYLVAAFDANGAQPQWLEDVAWIPALGIHYRVAVDGISLFLLLLTAGLWVVAILFSMRQSPDRPHLYYGMLALGETAVLGVFAAQDLALFVAFFDLMLVPFYFLIGIFGGKQRVKATTRFVIYTLVGSLLMLAGVVATGVLSAGETGELTFALDKLGQVELATGTQYWIFLFLALAFLVKMPAFPIHGWMPDAYRQAPIPVVALLSAVLSKVGAYGFLRIVLPLYPDAVAHFQDVLLLVAVASILYGSIMAFTATDARLVVGYSSVAQLGFITAGIFALRPEGAQGAILQMVNHGLVVAALFFIIAMLASRAGSEDLGKMGGAAFRGPVLAALFLIVALATLAMPGSANFVGELMILLAVFKAKIVYAIVASAGVAFAAVYMIRFFQRTMHGRLKTGVESRDIDRADGLVLVPLVAAIIGLAVYPQLILGRTDRSANESLNVARVSTGTTAISDDGSIGDAPRRSGLGSPPGAGDESPPGGAGEGLLNGAGEYRSVHFNRALPFGTEAEGPGS